MRVYKEMAEDLRNWPAGSYAHGQQRGAGSTGRSSRRRVRDCVVGMSGGHANMPLPCVQLKTGDRSRVDALCVSRAASGLQQGARRWLPTVERDHSWLLYSLFFSDLRSSVNEIRLSSADPYVHGARLTSESSPHQVLDAY